MNRDLFELHASLEHRHWWFRARRSVVAELVKRITPPSERPLIVDVGCGTGGTIGHLDPTYRRVGIDPAADAVALARQRFSSVEFIEGTAPADLGNIASEADLFLLMDVLEHVPDDFHLLSSLVAVARPGAQFLITVPAGPHLWSMHDESFGHYRRYTPERLACVWDGLPLTKRLFSYFNTRLYPLVRATRLLSNFRGRTRGVGGTDLRLPNPIINAALEGLLAGEAKGLCRKLDHEHSVGVATGVSLIVALRRGAEQAAPRLRPVGVLPDVVHRSSRPAVGAEK